MSESWRYLIDSEGPKTDQVNIPRSYSKHGRSALSLRERQCDHKPGYPHVISTVRSDREVRAVQTVLRGQMLGEMYFCQSHITETGEGGREVEREVFRNYKVFFDK